MKESIWNYGIDNKLEKELKEDIECDILIIGGGIAGLSTAYHLKDTNKKIVLIDKNKCANGITSHSSAKLTFVQSDIYHKLPKIKGKNYLKSQIEAIKIAKNIINKNKIKCDLESSPSYLFTQSEENINKIKQEELFYKENNIKYQISSKLPNKFPCKYAIKINGTYTFNPVKYLLSIKEIVKDKINIYENTIAINISKEDNLYITKTNNNTIKSKIVIVTTHYPFFIKPLFIPFKTNIEKSYLIVSETKDKYKFNAINTEKPTCSLRYLTINNKRYIMYVTGSHNISTNYNKEEVKNKVITNHKKFINKDIYTYFTNQDIITIDKLPYIGKIEDNMYIATGFNTWGMTNGTISGKIISDLIKNKKNEYIELFNPKRLPTNILNLIIYDYNNAKSFILSKLNNNYSFYKNNTKVIYQNKQKIGIYKDDSGNIHKVKPTCPHMKCSLIFNNDELTWDCPCHGSRFDIDGNILIGPSNHNIKFNRND